MVNASSSSGTCNNNGPIIAQVPIDLDRDSDRVVTIKKGLNEYFQAVSTPIVEGITSKEDKLQLIASTFSSEATTEVELWTSKGTHLIGSREQVVTSFYASDESPVMKYPTTFCPKLINRNTIGISQDENTIAVEIELTPSTIKVGDFFTFDKHGKIRQLRIYS